MLTYRSEGRGVPVVLLHAFPLYSALWEKEAHEISRYARVITPDLPGFGFSPRLQKPSLRGMAEEVGRLLETLEIQEPIVLGGLSMGGYVAFEFLRLFPGRVSALMLFSTRPGADTSEARENRLKAIGEIKTAGLEAFAEKIAVRLLGKHTLLSRPQLVREVAGMISSNKSEGVTDALYAMATREDSSGLLASVSCPCLIVAGKEDEMILPSESRKMHEKIQGSEFHEIPKVGHLVNLENPEWFEAIVLDFLKTKALELVQKMRSY